MTKTRSPDLPPTQPLLANPRLPTGFQAHPLYSYHTLKTRVHSTYTASQ